VNVIVPVFIDNGAAYMGDLWVAHEILTSLISSLFARTRIKARRFLTFKKNKAMYDLVS
jgi:hypothetical protein